MQAQLQPHFRQGAGSQGIQPGRIHAVRPGPHGKPHAVRQGLHPAQQMQKALQRAIGIGKGLQIRHEQAIAVGPGVFGMPARPLGLQIKALLPQAGAGPLGIAEGAAQTRQGPVPVGAAGTGIQWNFLHPLSVAPPEPCGQSVPEQHKTCLFPRFPRAAAKGKFLYRVHKTLTCRPFWPNKNGLNPC